MTVDLITGATGFIGRHLCRRLIDLGRSVRVFCRPESADKLSPLTARSSEIAWGDLRDRASIERAMNGASRVFHCAGHVLDWGSPETFYAGNVQGAQWLLHAALKRNVERFVHLSSIAVFGVPSPPYFDDSSPYRPGRDLYSQTKIQGEMTALRYFREHGLPVAVLRPAVVYGPHGTWVMEPLRMIRRNRMFLIDRGRGICHPCHVENLIDAMLVAAEHPLAVGQAYIVGDDQPISFAEYFNHLARIVGASPIRRSIPLAMARVMASLFETAARVGPPGKRPLLTHTAIDMVAVKSEMCMDKIRRELGFNPSISVERGMELLREWIDTHPLCALAGGVN